MNSIITKDKSAFTLFTLVVSLMLTLYFGVLSEFLPPHGGPDEGAHKGAASFIYEHNRLPVYLIRFDNGIAGDQIKISNLAYGELKYRQFIPQLNKIFRMDPAKHQPLLNAYSSRFK
jgi:hypothetical protein